MLLSYGSSFGVSNHFVHELYIIKLLMGGFDCLALDFVFVIKFLSFDVGYWQVLFLFLFELKHLLFLSFGKSEFVLLLLFSHLLLEFLLFLGGFADSFLH